MEQGYEFIRSDPPVWWEGNDFSIFGDEQKMLDEWMKKNE